jgi:hypothetical protein
LRPDLANKVSIFECTARQNEEKIEVDVSALDLYDQSLNSVAKVFLDQIIIVGCIVLLRISNVDKVCLKLHVTTSSCFGDSCFDPLGRLMPGFDCATAHTLHFAGL